MKKNLKTVDELLAETNHPLKAEIEMVRNIIKNVDKDITEEWKWNAPSFSYKENYLVTFNLRIADKIHLVFHNPEIPKIKSELLEGDYINRRMIYLSNTEDIKTKRAELERILKELIKLINK